MISDIKKFIKNFERKKWDPPPPPSHLSPIEFTNWLFDQDDMGWLKLDISFDLEGWKSESMQAEKYYVNHRDSENYFGLKHKGWMSCCIHGISIEKTQAEEEANQDLFHWTALSDEIPSITSFWKKFPAERFKRLRFMKLESKGFIGVHNDLPAGIKNISLKELKVLDQSIAINVAIWHPPSCKFVTEHFGTVPWCEGDIYIINVTKNHCVINESNFPRVHIIAECVIGDKQNEFAELIYKSYKKQHGYD